MTPAEETVQIGRVDTARYVLQRKHRWARRTLRSLKLVQKHHGTLSVDKWGRLYVDLGFVSTLSDVELVGVVWHEVNHLLRRHPDRLGFDPNMGKTRHMAANVGADVEINQDLRTQGITLPPNVCYPDTKGIELPAGRTAEHYMRELLARWAEEDKQAQQAMEDALRDDRDDDDPGEEQEDPDADDAFDDDEWRDPDDRDVPDDPNDDGDDAPGGGDDDEDGDAGDGDAQGGNGGGEDGTTPQTDKAGPGAGGGNLPVGDEGKGSPDSSAPPRPDIPGCGSAAGGEAVDEDDEPDGNQKARFNREQQKQAEDIVEEVENGGGYSDVGKGLYEIAKGVLGKSEHDWRKTMGAVIRAAMERAMDDKEELTFRRPSRRGIAIPKMRLPSGYRPVPYLWVVVDVSGSMDAPKVWAAMRETHGILERLALPVFMGLAWDTELQAEVTIQTDSDIDKLLDKHGGGTNMVAAINYAYKRGAEVVVCLTDAECDWQHDNTFVNGDYRTEALIPGRPLIIGGINRDEGYTLPSWAKVVDVEESA